MKKVALLLVSLASIAWLAKYVALPAFAYLKYADEYQYLAGKCANAMDESWFLEQKGDPSLDKTAQIHLLDCHEYDVTRKTMLSMGLSENVLSYLGLKGLEINQRTTEEFVQQHRFRER
jgi:His-Xaa-Ser system protein (TIGR03982 family)